MADLQREEALAEHAHAPHQVSLAKTRQYLENLQQPLYPPPCFPTPTEELLVPPLNFALVVPGIYRSGHPNVKNHPFLLKLGIKTIM
ncbi:tyrosine-protein phosphatase siw14 [Dimargaris verticillata]|uniref:Tyrosine-protein phosphatase siw14 n=1 Tax=Dimargaris verticillata TaxID=2761393 RepID=A0A9W8AXP1_9FUNG|nr:tyrosine-protein phosphatase siw14 [Dimargaris verticillata]